MNFKVAVLILLISLCTSILGADKPKPGRGKDRNKGNKLPRNSLQEISTCMGQPVDLKAQLESPVQECLDTRAQALQEQVDTNFTTEKGNEKKAKKKAKRKEKLVKRMRNKCLSECEWSTFELIPDVNDTATYPSVEIPDTFLSAFPKEAEETLKARIQACYNTTSPMSRKEGKKGIKPKMCFTNIRLMKCFNRVVRQTCNGKTVPTQSQPPSTTGSSTQAKSSASEIVASTTASSKVAAIDDDDGDDDDEEADDDNDDDDEDEDTTDVTVSGVTNKMLTPSTSIDTSKPLTK